MKKWVSLCAIALTIASCDNNRQFTIEGHVTDASGETLYLESLAPNAGGVLDSVVLDKNGAFAFKEDAPLYPEFYQLRLGESVVHVAIDSTETLTFSAKASDFANGYELTGSDECEKMRIVARESAKLKSRINELSQVRASKGNQEDELLDEVVKEIADYKAKMLDLALENPASASSYYIVYQEINGGRIFSPYDASDRKLIAAVATGFDMNYPQSPRTKQLKEMTLQAMAADRIAARQASTELEAEATTLLDIELYDHMGRKQQLSELAKKGKVILLDFTVYQTEVSPAYNMLLAELYRKYADRGLEIYQVSMDADEQAWRVSADNLPWVCVRDPRGIYSNYAAMYNVQQLPTCFVIDRSGGIAKRLEKATEIEKAIQAHL